MWGQGVEGIAIDSKQDHLRCLMTVEIPRWSLGLLLNHHLPTKMEDPDQIL
jgi:hypothetical protein